MIGLGIDTGGTCTDAVLYDTEKKEILSTGKTLTTKENLVIGIENALSCLDQEELEHLDFVSLSTTLATNACVENRGGKVKVIMIGTKPQDPEALCKKYGFDSADNLFFMEGIPKGGYCSEKEPNWDELEKQMETFRECEAVGVVQFFPEWNEGAFEKEARRRIEAHYAIPVICAGELFTDLDAYRRAAGTYLNARLIPIIQHFLEAVKEVLRKRGKNVPLYIMRSDGSLMNEEFTKSHPVETLLCGPTASTLGGIFGQNEKKALVVDMGGTTTDISIVQDGLPLTIPDGIKINGWKTQVKGLYVDTFGLGGDTCVRFYNGNVYLEPFRVIPISYVGTLQNDLPKRLRDVAKRRLSRSTFYFEGFVLQNGLTDSDYMQKERKLCERLKEGPMLVTEAAEYLGCRAANLPVERLEQEGAIMRFGLTPTDMMHIKGDYAPYDRDTVEAALHCFSAFSDISEESIPDLVYQAVEDKLYQNLVRICMERAIPEYEDGVPKEILQMLEFGTKASQSELLSCIFRTNYKLIGVGAPTYVFLPQAAKRMETEVVCHPYAQTANALGTLVGQVAAKRRIEITFQEQGFRLYAAGNAAYFEEIEEAEDYAIAYLKEETKKEARERGAVGEIAYQMKKRRNDIAIYGQNTMVSSVVEVTAHCNIF